MINVFMVDHSESTIREVKEYFSSLSSIRISKSFNDGKEALLDLLDHHSQYDVLLMDPILSGIDGIELLKTLKNHQIDIPIVIYSEYFNEAIISSLAQYQIAFYLLKGIDKKILAERVVDSTKLHYQELEFIDNSMLERVSKLLHDLGMPSHIKGYQYIREAVLMMHENSNYIGGITKILYPEIAKKYDTTASRVERAIRHAIEVSWSRGDYDLMDEIFGHSVDFDRAKPTNSEFLATISDRVALDEKKYKVKHY